jgi:Tol biopolymer transport system component
MKLGTHWTKVAVRTESAAGTAVFGVPTTTPGKFTYRALAVAFHGMAAIATSARVVTIVDTGKTTRVDLTPTGGQSIGSQNDDPVPAISADGRYVAFDSWASDLVPGDGNGMQDVFLRDRQTGTTTLISAAPDGTPGDSISAAPAISSDGRYVAYLTTAINIVPQGPCVSRGAVLLLDRQTGHTTHVDTPSDGSSCVNSTTDGFVGISGSGRYVAYWSEATNLTSEGQMGLFLYDRVGGTTTLIAAGVGTGTEERPSLSADGRYVAFATPTSTVVPGDTNNREDVFLWDRTTGTTRRVSVSATHHQGDGQSDEASISGNGRYVTYWTAADNLAPGTRTGSDKVLMWDRKSGKTSVVFKHASTVGFFPTSVSGDGSAVAFVPDVVGVDGTDVYVWDRATRRATRVSASPQGAQANFVSAWPAISANGRFVVFSSLASNLVPGDSNNHFDVFFRDRFPG